MIYKCRCISAAVMVEAALITALSFFCASKLKGASWWSADAMWMTLVNPEFTMIHIALALAAVAGTPDITLEFLGRTSSGGYDVSAAEVVAYDPATQRAFVVKALATADDLVDISVPAAPVHVKGALTQPCHSYATTPSELRPTPRGSSFAPSTSFRNPGR